MQGFVVFIAYPLLKTLEYLRPGRPRARAHMRIRLTTEGPFAGMDPGHNTLGNG